jgi:hypothetical protein
VEGTGQAFKLVLNSLEDFGLLLETDTRLPSVSGLVAGEPVRGSWWAHPRSHEIFAALQSLADHKDVLIARLISGKVTLVHRKLWPNVLAVGSAREEWQLSGLSPPAQTLLKMIDEHGSQRSDRLDWPVKFKSVKLGDAAREIERRLLIHSEEFHSQSGAHAKVLETWEHWARRVALSARNLSPEQAKRNLERRLGNLNERFSASAWLPWQRTR